MNPRYTVHLVWLPQRRLESKKKEDEDFVMMALAQNGMALGELKERTGQNCCSDLVSDQKPNGLTP